MSSGDNIYATCLENIETVNLGRIREAVASLDSAKEMAKVSRAEFNKLYDAIKQNLMQGMYDVLAKVRAHYNFISWYDAKENISADDSSGGYCYDFSDFEYAVKENETLDNPIEYAIAFDEYNDKNVCIKNKLLAITLNDIAYNVSTEMLKFLYLAFSDAQKIEFTNFYRDMRSLEETHS